jgi:hypothetical protein
MDRDNETNPSIMRIIKWFIWKKDYADIGLSRYTGITIGNICPSYRSGKSYFIGFSFKPAFTDYTYQREYSLHAHIRIHKWGISFLHYDDHSRHDEDYHYYGYTDG